MPELRWHDAARSDLLQIVDYISDDNLQAAQRIKDDIETKVRALADFPDMGRPGRIDGTREFVVKANYIIVYRERASIIEILRVLHAVRQWPAVSKI